MTGEAVPSATIETMLSRVPINASTITRRLAWRLANLTPYADATIDPSARTSPRGNGSLTRATSNGNTSTQPSTWRSTGFGVRCSGSSMAIIPVLRVGQGDIIPLRRRCCIQTLLELQLAILLQHLERCRREETRTAFSRGFRKRALRRRLTCPWERFRTGSKGGVNLKDRQGHYCVPSTMILVTYWRPWSIDNRL